MAQTEDKCELCEIRLWLHQSWKAIEALPKIGTPTQLSWVNLALSSLEMAHDLYGHKCEFGVLAETLAQGNLTQKGACK